MALPRAVQEAADAADAEMARMGLDPTGLPLVDPDTGLPIAAPVAPQAPVEPVVPATPPVAPTDVNWEHKYLTLKGMFDAEVPRLHAQNKDLTAQVNTIVGELAVLRSRPAPTPEAPVQLITDQDRESFGPDLVALIERGVKQHTQPLQAELERVNAENAQLKANIGNVAQTQASSQNDTFFEKLTVLVPELQVLNTDPAFMAWLSEIDPMYGLPRKAALDNAAGKFDVARCARIFDAYKLFLNPVGVVVPPVPNPAAELARQITPRKTANSTPPDPAAQKISWTDASIAQFYADCRRGALTTEQQAHYEADLQSAVAEGRVR